MIKQLEDIMQKAWELDVEISEFTLTGDQYKDLLVELGANQAPELTNVELNLNGGTVKIVSKQLTSKEQ